MGILFVYIIYFVISLLLLIYVGSHLHRHGSYWISYIINNDHVLATKVNDVLLLLYRTFNVGFLIYTLMSRENNDHFIELFNFFFDKIGFLLISLAYLHYQNIVLILIFSHFKYKYHE